MCAPRTHMVMTNWRIEKAPPHKHQQMSLLAVGAYSHVVWIILAHTNRIAFTYILFWCWRIFSLCCVRLFFCRCFTAILSIAVSARIHTDTCKWDDGRPVAGLYYLNRIELKSSRKYSTHFFKNLESDFVCARFCMLTAHLKWFDATKSSPSVCFKFARVCVSRLWT